MSMSDFTPADMKLVMLANERVFFALKLTNSDEHLRIKVRVCSLIVECAENGERDIEKLIDCAHEGLRVDATRTRLSSFNF